MKGACLRVNKRVNKKAPNIFHIYKIYVPLLFVV